MRGQTGAGILLAAVLLSTAAIVTVEGHGRSLQAQQALQLPKGFKIPNIFNTCEWPPALHCCGSGSLLPHVAEQSQLHIYILTSALPHATPHQGRFVFTCCATARTLLPSIIPGQFVVTMKENVTDLPSLLDM